MKDITFTETDKRKVMMKDPNIERGQREGTNKYGQFWTDEWEVNKLTGVKKWKNMTQEFSNLRNDGFESKWGQSGEEIPGEKIIGERWTEMIKESDNYWERRSERYTEYAKKLVDDLDQAIDTVLEAPRLIRSGISEFKNNRNFLKAEQWEEYVDGTLMKNIVHDNGFGKKTMEQQGRKLNIDKLEKVRLVQNPEGYFKEFVDGEGNKFKSL